MAIPISIHNQPLGVRLLELPAELVVLLESEDPPVLHLKSSEPPSDAQNPPNAVLCTADRSYEVRQVQSSNVLYVLQQSADSGFTSIAQCKGMLELVPSKAVAAEHVRQSLPVFSNDIALAKGVARKTLIDDAPFSTGQLADAFRVLCAFEKNDQMCIPDAKALLLTWKSFLAAAAIKAIKVDQPWNCGELEALVAEDYIDLNLYKAVMLRLNKESLSSEKVVFESNETAAWIGRTLLDSKKEPVPFQDFMTDWQDLLPEAWRGFAQLNILEDAYYLSDDGFINGVSQSNSSNSTANKTVPPKSKWHQKFRK